MERPVMEIGQQENIINVVGKKLKEQEETRRFINLYNLVKKK
jgi:hypothetical protein